MYIDNILVTACTEEGHLNNLTEVIRRLSETGIRLKKEKCGFKLCLVFEPYHRC